MISVGDIYGIDLGRDDNITPKNGYDTRYKYCVVIGTPEFGYYVAYLVVDHEINRKFNNTRTLQDNFFPLRRADYPEIIKPNYDPSWLDLTDYREMEKSRLEAQGKKLCRLTERDLALVIETIRKSSLLSPKKIKRLGLEPM